MSNNQSDVSSFPIYKLFFDDIEEVFLNTISFRVFNISILLTSIFIIGILILLLYRPTNVLTYCLNPFVCSLVLYDFIQLLSLIALKYNLTEKFFNQLCRWSYYLKSSAEAGQCLTIIFLFALSRHQIRYFQTHNQLPNSSRINSRALIFVCLLFIVYANNWITHLKSERIHLITSNETKYEINIQELHISLYAISDIKTHHHLRFINDLDRYTRGYEKNSRPQIQSDKTIHNHKDSSFHEIVIKFPYDHLFNPISNRSKRHKRHELVNNPMVDEHENNSSYHIKRCTYGQRNVFLSNFLSLIHSIAYILLIVYYLIMVLTLKIPNTDINHHHQQLDEKSVSFRRKKSVERHQQFLLLIQLKQFLRLIIYSHTLFTCIRLLYICSLTIILCIIQTPFQWLPLKIFFYYLFLISYFSIPLRMSLLFCYLFSTQFSTHIQSMFFYIFRTKLRFSWKLEKPSINFRFQCIPYTNRDIRLKNILVIDLSSTMDEDHSNPLPIDSVVIHDETSSNHHFGTTTTLPAPSTLTNQLTSSTSVIAKL